MVSAVEIFTPLMAWTADGDVVWGKFPAKMKEDVENNKETKKLTIKI